MSREQTAEMLARIGYEASCNKKFEDCSAGAKARWVQSAKAIRAALAPTVSGGEGWEELAGQTYEGCPLIEPLPEAIARVLATLEDTKRRNFSPVAQVMVRQGDLRALIAVARGGGALPPATPSSVPTEGHGAAVVGDRVTRLEKALNLALGYLIRFEPGDSRAVSDEFVAMSAVLHDAEPNSPDAEIAIIDAAAERLAAISDAEQVGTSVASEPNTLPTVQAETAVVGEALLELSRDLHRRADACHDLSKPDQSEAARRRLDGKEAAYRHAAQLAAQAIPPSHQPPVITGEQPGMSEANAPRTISLKSAHEFAAAHLGMRTDDLTIEPSITLPDDLLSLSEAATQGEWAGKNTDVSFNIEAPGGLRVTCQSWQPEGRRIPHPTKSEAKANRDLIVASVNFIRTLAAKQGGKS